eukprot:3893234-Rhodomonas_salina.1
MVSFNGSATAMVRTIVFVPVFHSSVVPVVLFSADNRSHLSYLSSKPSCIRAIFSRTQAQFGLSGVGNKANSGYRESKQVEFGLYSIENKSNSGYIPSKTSQIRAIFHRKQVAFGLLGVENKSNSGYWDRIRAIFHRKQAEFGLSGVEIGARPRPRRVQTRLVAAYAMSVPDTA